MSSASTTFHFSDCQVCWSLSAVPERLIRVRPSSSPESSSGRTIWVRIRSMADSSGMAGGGVTSMVMARWRSR